MTNTIGGIPGSVGSMPMASTPMAGTASAAATGVSGVTPFASATPTGSTTSGATSSDAASTAAAGSAGTSASGATTAASNSQLAGTDTFLQLLVAQMRNQDPSQPMDDQSFVTELAQFNTVEQMLALKQSVDAQASAQQSAEGVALIGKTVAYTVPGIGNNAATVGQGVVGGVSLQGGAVQLQVGGQSVPLSQVTMVAGQ